MLDYLEYSVIFPTTRQAFSVTTSFHKGLTSITGPNESGKSLILEMVRYSLFGKSALRGISTDYINLKTKLEFIIHDKRYRIIRTRRKETLEEFKKDCWTEIAVGTSTLNTKIPELLGFSLKVFDIACSCNQGDIEALGNMKPTERKHMIDKVIGLTTIDQLQAWASNESTSFKHEAEIMSSTLIKPEKPKKPKGYRKSNDLKIGLEKIKKQQKRQIEIEVLLSSGVEKPTKPDDIDVVESEEELKEQIQNRNQILDLITTTTRKHDSIPDVRFTEKELDDLEDHVKNWHSYQSYQLLISGLPDRPVVSIDECETELLQWDRWTRWTTKKKLLEQGMNECPSCHYEWPIADLGTLKDVQITEKPSKSIEWYNRQIGAIDAWETVTLPDPIPEEVFSPKFSMEEVVHYRKALSSQDHKTELADKLLSLNEKLNDIPNRIEDLIYVKEYNEILSRYNSDRSKYDKWCVTKVKLEKELKNLDTPDKCYDDVFTAFSMAIVYEKADDVYKELKDNFDKIKALIKLRKDEAEEYRKATLALKLLRKKIKQHLVPSLNRVASVLLSQMTQGARTTVVVDEDFNVEIDGQPLNTLSGSGKAVSNLAIRIGLGQVLTNSVFSLFMGDEIDASMDQERAGATNECMRGLTTLVSQVIMVSHKSHSADHYVELN